ncbi:MAG: hypothetical protein ABI045_07475 [Flavobacteriales bacterium]
MPFNKNFTLQELLKALQYWYEKTKSRITFEYVLCKDINDGEEDIHALVKFCRNIPSKVNPIEYNSIDEEVFQQAKGTVLKRYTETLETNNIVVKIRHSRGKDIDAACGQLTNKNPLISSTSNLTLK